MIRYPLTCKACPTTTSVEGGTEKECLQFAAEDGWEVDTKHRGQDLCPACVNASKDGPKTKIRLPDTVYRPDPNATLADIAAVVLGAGYGSSDVDGQTLVDDDGWLAALHLAGRVKAMDDEAAAMLAELDAAESQELEDKS